MHDSLNPQPLPEYCIPVTIDGKTGMLRPVDNYEPTRSYMVYIEGKWIGTLHFLSGKWHFDNRELQQIKDELGEAVIAWVQ